MSISDLKHSLRKFEFPVCAKEALVKIEQLLTNRGAPSSKHLDVAMDIISEFIFCEADRRGGRRGLNSLQELQLIDVICEYLSDGITETAKNTIFLSLFGGIESQKRLKILCILASMAVSALNTPSTLKSLASSAPQFVANFITAVTELYMHDTQGKKMPPKNLLEVITSWVYSNATLCMSAQLNPAALPNGAIPMTSVTPLAGLIRWCALAPLNIKDDNCESPVPSKKIKIEGDKETSIIKHLSKKDFTESELYRKLHLGVLTSLRAGRRTQGPPTAVNAQHIIALTPIVQACAHQLLNSGIKLTTHPQLQECLDRIGQAVQVSLANGCIYGNVSTLLAALHSLPENRLLHIVVSTHQQAM
ncbi:Uncharacterized protein C7orf26 [Eumeta japonica]|uniref:Uncharacterized protein C7orf26 n=1 Tax=Eumeta variegata TaxID=151549 RepID=A0A4C1Y3V0_EUMVA|nr:Uncharacterized protein C7orf26 [Eumeta japonica]